MPLERQSDQKSTPEKHMSMKERIEANKGAGYCAMVGAVAGSITLGPIGAAIGGAVGGGLGSIIDHKFRHPQPHDDTE